MHEIAVSFFLLVAVVLLTSRCLARHIKRGETACSDVFPVSRDSLPAGPPTTLPCYSNHDHCTVYKSATIRRKWTETTRRSIRGLNFQLHDVIDMLEEEGCAWMAWGEGVRELLEGRTPRTIELATTCTFSSLVEVCRERYGRANCRFVNDRFLEISGTDDEDYSVVPNNDAISVVTVSFWNAEYEVFESPWQFAPNTLAIMEHHIRSTENLEVNDLFVLDVGGTAVDSACTHHNRIPLSDWYWSDASRDAAYAALLRFWKLRVGGFRDFTNREVELLTAQLGKKYKRQRFIRAFRKAVVVEDHDSNTRRGREAAAEADGADDQEQGRTERRLAALREVLRHDLAGRDADLLSKIEAAIREVEADLLGSNGTGLNPPVIQLDVY